MSNENFDENLNKIKINDLMEKIDKLELRIKRFEGLIESIVDSLHKVKTKPLVNEIIFNARSDERFFKEFVNFLERDQGRREVLLAAVKRILIESSENIFD